MSIELGQQINLLPPENMEPLEDKAIFNLKFFTNDEAEYTKFIQIFGLEEALCRSSNQPMNNLGQVAI